MDTMRLTVLVDNQGGKGGLLSEHGWSLLLEKKEVKILFDTGQSALVLANARALNLRLDDLTYIVLSHGHYDHTGGLRAVLDKSPQAKVFCHTDAFKPRFSRQSNHTMKHVGMDETLARALTRGQDAHRVVAIKKLTEIAPNIWITGPIPRNNDFEDTGGQFYLDETGSQPDLIYDDQALCAHTDDGLVVIFGCAHAGVVNTLQFVHEHFPNIPIHTIIGGLHIKDNHHERLEKTVDLLRGMKIHRIVPSHCTGPTALACIAKELQQQYESCHISKQWTFNAAG